ncbi:hypothetical protein K4L06_09265 [Lysobacter sp. BMK333-48F3]|uniref:XVIPCD domain-containing protein n=1 Tax=Lysobacter sp. BMK333-48F3 TaxID=2867962 RepID=UPI001C8B21B9|nr:XVIPCD domain-containing protein [Lysobacter sp. BMK333-48F3]MBX9401501.1 hypothetical protein [Lysobacter sp. BMK333-48F3]
MALENAKLQAAIQRFAAQQGVTADQVAQLQSTIATDQDLLARLNAAAQAGQLKGFDSPSSSGAPNLVGRYDLATGMVTLPASDFQSGSVPRSDLGASLRVQAMSIEFAHGTYQDATGARQLITQDMLNNFQQAMNDSPVLAQQVKLASTVRPEPHLKHFAITSVESGLGGGYDGVSRTLTVPAVILQPGPNGRVDRDNLTFTVAHEVGHGFAHADFTKALTKFDNDVMRIAKDSNPINDYTVPIGERIQAARENEAKAQLAGWNALVSKHQQAGPVGLDDMYRASKRAHDFVEYDVTKGQAVPKQGFVLGTDMMLSETPSNVAAAGKYYFDKFPKGHAGVPVDQTATIGPHREADNINYAGKGAVSRAITLDRTFAHAVNGVEPQMHINMAQLRLDERLIERLGLAIKVRSEERQPYYDTSQTPASLRHFDHTRSGANLNQHVPLEPVVEGAPVANKPGDPTQPSHPDHQLYGQIRDLVRAQDQQHGRQWDQTSERLTASLLALSKEAGLTRVDHVVFSARTDRVAAGENVFVVQGRLDDPAHVRAHMKTEEATRTPEIASFAKVEALNDRAMQQAPALQAQQQPQDEQQSRGFGMGR